MSRGLFCNNGQILVVRECRLLAKSGHANRADECPLLGAKRTVTNRCLPISIYVHDLIVLR